MEGRNSYSQKTESREVGRAEVESRENGTNASRGHLALGSKLNFAGDLCAMIISGIFSHLS